MRLAGLSSYSQPQLAARPPLQFLKHHANVHAAVANKAIPLYIVPQSGHADVVNVLLESRADADAAPVTGATPLCIGAQNGHVEVVSALLKNGASVDSETANGVTPLFSLLKTTMHRLWLCCSSITQM